jgi:general secretion pathway protein A
MYVDHYNLKEKPFQTTPDPKYIWLGEKHAEALATLEYGIRENIGFLVLTGDVGTGKTAVINCLLNEIDHNVIVAKVPNPSMAPVDFFNFLSKKLKWEMNFSRKGKFLSHLEDFLHRVHSENKKVLLIIDEAQRLSHQLLEEIRLLSNIELDNKKLLNIFFVGQSEFNKILFDERNKALRERITVWYHIEPLGEKETQKYIHHRLKIAGSNNETFMPDAIKVIYTVSAGNPRQINIICDHALVTGFSSGAKEIDENIIAECAKDLRISLKVKENKNIEQKMVEEPVQQIDDKPGKDSRRLTQMVTALTVILFIISGYLIYVLKSDDSQRRPVSELIHQKQSAYWENEELISNKKSVSSGKTKAQFPAKTNDQAENRNNIIQQFQTPLSSKGKEESQGDKNSEGSLLKQNFIVYFKHDSNEIQDAALEKLDQLSKLLIDYPETNIRLKGYSDNSGAYGYNVHISKLIANAVKNYLVSKGLNPLRIEVFGLGPINLISSKQTLEGKRLNRRVEIEFYSKKSM